MRKLSLTEWAEIGEVIGMVAVVASLLLVVYSINQNTRALQGTTDNLIFERHAELQAAFIEDESLAAILVKLQQPDPRLSKIEEVRWWKYRLNLLDIWAMAYLRHREGLMGPQEWQAWNRYFVTTFNDGAERLSQAEWEELKYGFDPDFWDHVRRSLGFSGEQP